MADINKTININVNAGGADNQLDDLTKKLDNVNGSTTRVTQSTNLNTRSLENNKKSVLENGGAMGLLGAATGGLAMDFKDAVEAIEMTGISLKGLRGAIIATGIGALAILLLELITNWDKWIGVIDGSTKALEELDAEIKKVNLTRADTILLSEREIGLAEAQGVEEAKLAKMREENSKKLLQSYDDEIEKINEKIETEKNAFDTDEENLQKLQDEREKLRNERYSLETKLEIDLAKEKKRLQDLETERIKKANQDKLDADKKYLQDSIAEIKKFYDDIDAKSKEIVDISNSAFGKTYDELSNLYKIASDLIGTQNELVNKIDAVNKKIQASNNPKELQELISQFNKLVELQQEARAKADAGALLSLELQDEILVQLTKETSINNEIINQYVQLNKLKLEEVKINNQLFEYEKSIDGRLDNSNKFVEIETRINSLYTIRRKIIEEVKEAERAELQIKQNLINETLKELIADEKLLSEKIKGREDFTETELDRINDLQNEALLSNKNEIELQQDKNLKILDLQQQLSVGSVAIAKNTSDLELELAVLNSDKKFEIEVNRVAKEQALRDEKLERERLYYGAVMGIASESSNFLDALINNGHLRDKKAAENALALRKVIGVASVVIAGQEEIRGIWANPSLTALPDTGVVSKTLLTAAAVARGGLSIATILAQKLSGGGSMGTGSAGASAPQASFNVVGTSTNNQLAATLAAQQQQPVKAYVVGSDITTQQALDRNIQKNATFL